MKEIFGRWEVLLIHHLKRDWKKIAIWVLSLSLFSAGLLPTFVELAKGEGLVGMYETLKNPAMIAIIGPSSAKDVESYHLGAMYAHEMLFFSALFAIILSVLHVISRTRMSEEFGISELVRSFSLGRQANSLAVMVEVFLIHCIMALAIAGILLSFSVETISFEGAFLFALSIALSGCIAAVVSLCMGELFSHSSTAKGVSFALIIGLYILRGATDLSNPKLSYLNPLAWSYLSFPFTENNWKPVLYALIFCSIILVIAFFLEAKRDLGFAYIPEKEGRSNAKKSLLSIPGLFFHLQKFAIFSWLFVFFILSASYGAIYGDMETFLDSNTMLKQMFTQTGVSLEVSFSIVICIVMLQLVAVFSMSIVHRLYTEEKNLRLNQVYSTQIKRSEVYWTGLGIAVFVAFIAAALVALGLGGTALLVMSESSMNLRDFFIIIINFVPALLFFIGISALFLGFAPKFLPFSYFYLAYSFFINYFSSILTIHPFFLKITAIPWLSKNPLDTFDLPSFFLLLVLSFILLVLGFIGYRKRDLRERS